MKVDIAWLLLLNLQQCCIVDMITAFVENISNTGDLCIGSIFSPKSGDNSLIPPRTVRPLSPIYSNLSARKRLFYSLMKNDADRDTHFSQHNEYS